MNKQVLRWATLGMALSLVATWCTPSGWGGDPASTPWPATVLALGPLGYWPLDETAGSTAYDALGERNGAAKSGASPGVAGPRPPQFKGFQAGNTAFAFDGAGGAVDIPPLNLNQAAFTIVAWIQPNGAQDDLDGIVFSEDGRTVAGLNYQQGGQLGYHWNDAPNTYAWRSGLYPASGAWNFVALVVEPQKATLYLDDFQGFGLQSSANHVTHNAEEFDGLLRFGAGPGTGRFFRGAIDDVAIYDWALTTTEVKALRDAGINGTEVFWPVQILEQPRSETVMAGARCTLSAKAIGSLPLTLQWKKNGQDVPNANGSRIVFSNASTADTGVYQLFVTQGTVTVATDPATLTVKPVPSYLDLADGLVLHLKFDGHYEDSSGHGNHGAPQGAPQIVSGKIGTGALQYSTTVEHGIVTSAKYVSLGTPADLDFGPGQSFSVAFWVKFTGAPGDLSFLANNSLSFGDIGITLAPSYNEGGWSWSLNDAIDPQPWPGIGLYDPAQNTLSDGQWHHLVHVFDRDGDATTWLDGAMVHAASIAAAADWDFRTGAEWTVGQAGGGYAEAGVFALDDLGVWRRVLTDYEARAIYVVGQNHARSFDSKPGGDVRLDIQQTAQGVVIQWPTGTLESAGSVAGQWSPVAGAAPPALTVKPGTGAKFYRVSL